MGLKVFESTKNKCTEKIRTYVGHKTRRVPHTHTYIYYIYMNSS